MKGLTDETFVSSHGRICARNGCGIAFIPRNVSHKFCTPDCADYRPDTGPAKPSVNKPHEVQFVGVDGEGMGKGRNHRYVLLGVGSIQREWPDGISRFTEICEFLYGCFRDNPKAIYSGFFLGYDFNMWLRLLPRERAAMLISPQGIAKRSRKSPLGQRLGPFPVEFQGWEFDLLGMKRFKLKPKGADKWMYICDAGPFFQTSLLTAIDPRKWREPIVTDDEFELIKAGKERRDSAVLDDEMRFYNRLENDVFARLMKHLQLGLSRANVNLKKQQWFGPGQAAQAWMRLGNKLERTTKAVRQYKQPLIDAAIATYYGGWFEIPVHGHIPGTTYEYDINSAYPYVASRLPCLCGRWKHGTGTPRRNVGNYRMVNIIVRGKDKFLGPLPYRREDGRVLRPCYTEGWYWQHEVDAAKRAGLISEITYLEWYEYWGCEHPPPMKQLEGLYESRLRIGKDTPEGKAFKLVYNSVYGKFAQSEGEPVFANPFYASLITAGCRTMVLDAIATHPKGSSSVVMVATDGVYFTSSHPVLDMQISESMGAWSKEERYNLTVFKPGVYWDDKAREQIAQGDAPTFKSRGINAADFAQSIATVDEKFRLWEGSWLPGMPPGREDWPSVEFHARFTQVSIRQALQWTAELEPPKQISVYKGLAGLVQDGKKLIQDSWPDTKRNPQSVWWDGSVWRSQPWKGGPHWPASTPYDRRFGMDDDTEGFSGYSTPDGPAMLTFRQALGVG
jgi:hypothetical protein